MQGKRWVDCEVASAAPQPDGSRYSAKALEDIARQLSARRPYLAGDSPTPSNIGGQIVAGRVDAGRVIARVELLTTILGSLVATMPQRFVFSLQGTVSRVGDDGVIHDCDVDYVIARPQ